MPDWGSLIGRLRRSTPVGAAVAAVGVAACTLVITPLETLAPVDSLGPVYLVVVVVVALTWGVPLGIATALASAAAFDWFHIPPDTSLAISGTRNWVALGVFLVAAISTVMVAGLAQRLREVEALRRREAESRTRVVAAADAERRRVVRDLHDGAQQRLVHTVITLKLAERALRRGETTTESLLAEALAQAETATSELRELAHGILPATLTRGGLRAGVDSLVSRSPLPVRTDVAVERLDATVEATAYFVVSEALTNTAKHAEASHAEVSARVEHGALHVEVRDDGVGGARVNGSTGLLGLEDRVAALHGRLVIRSPPGAGTVVHATLPLRRRAARQPDALRR
jgi:signal transduction histidine kinase